MELQASRTLSLTIATNISDCGGQTCAGIHTDSAPLHVYTGCDSGEVSFDGLRRSCAREDSVPAFSWIICRRSSVSIRKMSAAVHARSLAVMKEAFSTAASAKRWWQGCCSTNHLWTAQKDTRHILRGMKQSRRNRAVVSRQSQADYFRRTRPPASTPPKRNRFLNCSAPSDRPRTSSLSFLHAHCDDVRAALSANGHLSQGEVFACKARPAQSNRRIGRQKSGAR